MILRHLCRNWYPRWAQTSLARSSVRGVGWYEGTGGRGLVWGWRGGIVPGRGRIPIRQDACTTATSLAQTCHYFVFTFVALTFYRTPTPSAECQAQLAGVLEKIKELQVPSEAPQVIAWVREMQGTDPVQSQAASGQNQGAASSASGQNSATASGQSTGQEAASPGPAQETAARGRGRGGQGRGQGRGRGRGQRQPEEGGEGPARKHARKGPGA